nr:thioredoxin family protein [uncultured Kingella sp.]
MKAVFPLLVAAVLLSACAPHTAELQQLRAKLVQQETEAKLSAARTRELQQQYTDMYFRLDSLTVESFKAKVARGDTFYSYIGRPSCSDCNAFEPLFARYIREHRLNGKLYFVNVHFLQQDKAAWQAFKTQYGLKGTPVLAKYSGGRQINKLDQEENGGMEAKDIEAWLQKNGL